jgi:hypothetical protein
MQLTCFADFLPEGQSTKTCLSYTPSFVLTWPWLFDAVDPAFAGLAKPRLTSRAPVGACHPRRAATREHWKRSLAALAPKPSRLPPPHASTNRFRAHQG